MTCAAENVAALEDLRLVLGNGGRGVDPSVHCDGEGAVAADMSGEAPVRPERLRGRSALPVAGAAALVSIHGDVGSASAIIPAAVASTSAMLVTFEAVPGCCRRCSF